MSPDDVNLVDSVSTVVMAVAAVASLVVAGAAVIVARGSKDVARDAVEVAERSAETARRQMALQAVPYVIASPPASFANAEGASVRITNVGALPALGVMAIIEPAQERLVGLAAQRVMSSRHAHLLPDESAEFSVPFGDKSLITEGRWHYPYLVVRVEYYGPQGAHVSYWYDYETDPSSTRWRIRRLVIDPRDAREPIEVEVALGLSDEPPDDWVGPQIY
jgi:hypothetical protein